MPEDQRDQRDQPSRPTLGEVKGGEGVDAERQRRVDALRQAAHAQAEHTGTSAPLAPAAVPAVAQRERRWPIALAILAVIIVAGLIAGGIATIPRLMSHASPATTPTALAERSPAPVSRASVRGFRDFAVPTPGAKPLDIARGSDGALWFTEFDGDKIGRITPDGSMTEYPVPTPGVAPYLIAASADGALWFTEYYGNKIGRVTTSGAVTEFALPDPNSSATGITAGPDGAVWVAAYPAEIDRVASDGTMTRFNLPTPSPVPLALAAGSDGALWFTYDAEFTSQDPTGDNRIGRITPTGVVSEYALPTLGANVDDIVAGPDGALWFTDFANDQIGALSTNGVIREYPAHSPYTALNAIAAGPDGALWFTRQDGVIGRITTGGAITTFTLPTPNSQPNGIAAGSGKTLWIAETGANRIGCLTLQ